MALYYISWARGWEKWRKGKLLLPDRKNRQVMMKRQTCTRASILLDKLVNCDIL